jgi:hypothetical protein
MIAPRPNSIIWFEWLYLATIPVGLLRTVISATTRGADWPSSLIVPALVVAIPLLFALRVSRRRSNIAKWLLTAWFAIWLVAIVASIASSGARSLSPESFIIVAIQTVALGLLFTASARAWLAGRKSALPARPRLKSIFE